MKLAYYLFLEFCSRRYESFSQAISFSANLPNFNPAMSKFNSFARNSQTSQSKTFRINSVPDSSEIMYVTYQVRHDLTLINEIAHVFNRKMSNQVKCSPRNETISMLKDTYYPNCSTSYQTQYMKWTKESHSKSCFILACRRFYFLKYLYICRKDDLTVNQFL